MSISVDDLVASLNANHIGQEAIDLANLQAQLAQTLYCHTPPLPMDTPTPRHRGYAQPLNTPTSRTPSSSFSFDRSEFHRRRSSSVASARARGSTLDERSEREPDVEEMDEDERMVEDLLVPSSPISANATSSHFPASQYPSPPSTSPPSAFSNHHMGRKYNTPPSSYPSNQHEYPPMNTSLFTTTDPFYLAQLQASQKPSSSYFAHAGRPSQQSPFVMAHQSQPPHSHSFTRRIPNPPEVEHNAFYASAAAR